MSRLIISAQRRRIIITISMRLVYVMVLFLGMAILTALAVKSLDAPWSRYMYYFGASLSCLFLAYGVVIVVKGSWTEPWREL